MNDRDSNQPTVDPLTEAEAVELEALEARAEPHIDELLASVRDLFPADVIDAMKESLVSFSVTHPIMSRMLKRVGPPPVVAESGTLRAGEPVEGERIEAAKRSRGRK